MKNKFYLILFLVLFSSILKAENLTIQANKITLDKKAETTIFENEVNIITSENNVIKSDYAEHNKKWNNYS